jgi:protein-S-isoprenylcysteine O-methyltransferase Ste14
VKLFGRFRRVHLHALLALVGLLLARPTAPALFAGAALVLAGLALRLWAAGLLDKDGPLCTDGPYRYLRHPLYLGSVIGAAGFAVMMHVIWGWLVILPLFLLLYTAQVFAEERHLRSLYGPAHAEFAAAVPLLLPWPGRVAHAQGRPWRFSQAVANREPHHIVFTLGLVALFVVKWLLVR